MNGLQGVVKSVERVISGEATNDARASGGQSKACADSTQALRVKEYYEEARRAKAGLQGLDSSLDMRGRMKFANLSGSLSVCLGHLEMLKELLDRTERRALEQV